ncbi:hypothetical protein Salat_0848700 [Sesamum alatum]|uniref:Uncharacterized protein n=1 Tax=Sesamum alatum TaxID=300844 RepID=A0AAE1YIQ8_9LAMI|nr:hypothetical protein Salat_0848700 [Sesamum alatum]
MTAAAGGSSPPSRSYRDAVAGMAVRPPPPPISFDTASFRPMGMLTRDQGMKVLRFSDDEIARGKRVVFAEHDTRPNPGASTSGSKGDGEETCGDMPREETAEPVVEEVAGGTKGSSDVPHTTPAVDQQIVEEMTGSGREPVIQGPTIGQSQDLELPTPGHVEHGSGDSLETRPDVDQAGGHTPIALATDTTRDELPECVENTSDRDLSPLVTGTEDEVIGLTGEGVVQTDEEAVSKRVARHRRGRSMGEDPSGQSASPDYGKAVSPPRRIVTRSTVRSTIP